jgi:chromosome segregation ATPase
MASKLTNAELKGILALTERVKKMEALVVQFQVENEDVRARLERAEGAKNLLVGKLSKTEEEVKRAREGENDKERQRVVDQEVIGFLDGKVQELEGGLKTTVRRLVEVEEKARRDVAQWQEQVRVLQDMLGFERRKAEENEGLWRQQKKILAKEVKNLRNEVLMRQKERDAYRDELHNVRLGGGGGRVSGGGVGLSRR